MDLYDIRKKLNIGMPLTQIKLRVTDYSRVSTEHLEQQSSLKNQIEHFDDMIKNNPNWIYIDGYVDDGISGTSDIKRENFMKMIEDAKNGKFDLIITKEISRFSRNTLDSIKYTRVLLNYGVAVLFLNDNINTALPDSELRLTIMASMAQDEIRRLSERVKFGINQSIKRGNILGNNLIYGYIKDKATGNLKIVEQEAEVITRIFTMYAVDKLSISRIAYKFNDEGIKTHHNNKWTTSTISRMIQNPKYKGYYCGKKSEVIDYMTKKIKYFSKDNWIMYKDYKKIPPIVSEELWNRANNRLLNRKKIFGVDYKDKLMYQNRYPLSAKIYCSNDNEVFHRRKHCKATDDITWLCAKYLKEGKKTCNSPNLRESEIYVMLKDTIEYLSIDVNHVSKILLELYKDSENSINIDEKIIKYRNEKNKFELKKNKILELNIEGNLSNSEFCKLNNRFNLDINRINKKIKLLEKNKEELSKTNENQNRILRLLNRYINGKETLDMLIHILLKKIMVSKINNNDNYIEMNVFLKFPNKHILKKISSTTNIPKKIITKEYEFKRGINIKSTKRYIMKYRLNLYIYL